jgi:response regulator RpfG family c-di-GMP phosphodiesterase
MMNIPKIEIPALRADDTTQRSVMPVGERSGVLIVDDTPSKLVALAAIVSGMDLEIVTATSGEQALRQLLKRDFAVILLDVKMPMMDGFETATLIRSRPRSVDTPIIFVTAEANSEAERISGYTLGAVDFIYSPIIPEILRAKVQVFVNLFYLQRQVLLYNEHLEKKVEQRTEQLNNTMRNLDQANKSLKKQYIDSIKAFSRIIEMRPGIKSGQSKYIAEKALLVARELGMNAEQKQNIFYAGLLIQIGKMSLPDALLAESYYSIPLIDKQRYIKHAVEGEALLKGLTQLKGASILIRHQFERYDGSGFPDHLAKQNIPLGSRILKVVGDYIAYLEGSMTGEVMTVSAAISQLMTGKESHYDPDVIDAFVKVLKKYPTVEEEVELPVVRKSWKNSRLLTKSENVTVANPVIEISWLQLKPGMEVISVYCDGKPYLRNCILDQKIISNIVSLKEKIGINPVILIRMGAK